VQSSENKLFSEKVGKKAVLAAYRVRGLFLCGQIAYRKRFGIGIPLKIKNFQKIVVKIALPMPRP